MIKEDLEAECPRLAELPFDSVRKIMTTINKINGKNIVIVKGAFDIMQGMCFSDGIAAASVVNEEMSSKALRVIAVAFKELDELPDNITSDEPENNLTFMGLLGMTDPPRPEAASAIKTCLEAGIRPVMITGDHIVTASAVAKDLGILTTENRAITGAELDKMTDTEFFEQI